LNIIDNIQLASMAKSHTIRSAQQLAVLAAAARQEIVDVLAAMGTVSVAELAAALNRPADSLYFHLRALVRAGLVEQVVYRRNRGRKEALFRTVASELFLEYKPRSASNRRGVNAIVSSMFRLGVRDFRRACEAGNATVSGPRRELWALRKSARLSVAQIEALNRSIKRVAAEFSPSSREGRLYAVTILLTPLDHRAGKSTRITHSPGAKKQ
jgi:DNA-binding transcriptional ArsR family regulator